MKINERKEANLVPLRAIQFGEAFEHTGRIFIKCLSDKSNGETPNRTGMDVDTGRLLTFDAKTLVRELDAEIIINQ